MGGGGKCVSGAGFLKPFAGVYLAGCMPGLGVFYFVVGSVLGFLAMLHASESEVGGEWASPERWAALARSVSAHHLFVAMPLMLLAARVWRLGRRCDAVEGVVRNADAAVQTLRVGGVVCAVCGTKIQALKGGGLGVVRANGCADKPLARSLAAEFEQEADTEEEDDAAGEENGTEEGDAEHLRRRLAEERRLTAAALEELEKERRAAASAADEAMTKIASLQNEKALVEREARQLREMAQQKQLYDRQMIESLQWVITRFGMPCGGGEAEASLERALLEANEDGRDRR